MARPERRQLSLTLLIDRTLTLIRGRAEKQKVDLRFVPPTTPILVEGVEDQLQQLLLNLALNALDMMPRGGFLEVEIRASQQGKCIFDPFVTSKESGLGLGLPVSRRIAEDHGGNLTASNRPDGGACFVFHLPALPE